MHGVDRPLPSPRDLTPRQREVLELVAKGLTNPEICGVLGISRGTVKIHLAAIYRALEVTNRTEAAVALTHLESADEARASTLPAPDPRGRRAIAVLPFDDLRGDTEPDYFADGLVEELIKSLSRFRWFPVIARQSSFQYRGPAKDIARVGRELGAAYVVEGSVRRTPERVRVTTQLVDTATNAHVWAESLDFPTADVFDVQEEIARGIAAALHPELILAEAARARALPRPDLDAWLITMRGLSHLESREQARHAKAVDCLERALARDPHSLVAAFSLAIAHYQALFLQWSVDSVASLAGLREAAARCVRIAPTDAYALLARGIVQMVTGDGERAVRMMRAAVVQNPSSARALSFLGQLVGMRGDPDQGITLLQEAVRLSPRDPMLFSMFASIGICHFAADRLEDARYWLQRSIDLRDSEPLSWAMLAACAALLGWEEEARLAVDELTRVAPSFRLAAFRRVSNSVRSDYLDRFEAGLRHAGFVDPVVPGGRRESARS